jgi:hypothetical protein
MDEINLPYQDFYFADWRMGCSGMTAQQEGIYIRLYSHLGSLNGRGLKNDFNFLCRMLLDHSDDIDYNEQQKKDLAYVLNAKLTLIDGRYHIKRQKKLREDKVDLIKLRQESGKKGGLAKAKQTSSKVSDSESIYNNIWSKLSIRRGSKQVAFKSWLKVSDRVKPEILIEKYNQLCSQSDDPKFIPHFSSWLNQERWEEELNIKKEVNEFGIQTKKSHLDYVNFVKKGIRSTSISDDMVAQMLKENLITEEEFKAW